MSDNGGLVFKKAAEKVMLAGIGVVMLVGIALFGTDDSDELDDWMTD